LQEQRREQEALCRLAASRRPEAATEDVTSFSLRRAFLGAAPPRDDLTLVVAEFT
jgi:hypothetical protein